MPQSDTAPAVALGPQINIRMDSVVMFELKRTERSVLKKRDKKVCLVLWYYHRRG